jgi:hypothetical protein
VCDTNQKKDPSKLGLEQKMDQQMQSEYSLFRRISYRLNNKEERNINRFKESVFVWVKQRFPV